MFDGVQTTSTPASNLVSDNLAVTRCRNAWTAAYKEVFSKTKSRAIASLTADNAYRNAMPPLSGRENIRDFIACAAHGILIGAIQESKATKLFYAAQVALGSLKTQPEPRKPA